MFVVFDFRHLKSWFTGLIFGIMRQHKNLILYWLWRKFNVGRIRTKIDDVLLQCSKNYSFQIIEKNIWIFWGIVWSVLTQGFPVAYMSKVWFVLLFSKLRIAICKFVFVILYLSDKVGWNIFVFEFYYCNCLVMLIPFGSGYDKLITFH